MWAYPESTFPDCPSPEELSTAEEETRIRKVPDFTAIPSLGAGPDALQRGIPSIRVGTSDSVSAASTILSLHCASDIVLGLGDSHGNTWGVDFSVDAPGWSTSGTSNGAARSHEERERERSARCPSSNCWHS
jgi:hypothetical protein